VGVLDILSPGYERIVRSRFGIDEDDLLDDEINQPLISGLAEAIIIKRVPDHASVVDNVERLYLENAVVSQICYILCPSMPRRLNLKIAISDVKLEKERVDWEAWAEKFLSEVDSNLDQITSVPVDEVYGSGGSGLVGLIRRDRIVVGGDS